MQDFLPNFLLVHSLVFSCNNAKIQPYKRVVKSCRGIITKRTVREGVFLKHKDDLADLRRRVRFACFCRLVEIPFTPISVFSVFSAKTSFRNNGQKSIILIYIERIMNSSFSFILIVFCRKLKTVLSLTGGGWLLIRWRSFFERDEKTVGKHI